MHPLSATYLSGHAAMHVEQFLCSFAEHWWRSEYDGLLNTQFTLIEDNAIEAILLREIRVMQ